MAFLVWPWAFLHEGRIETVGISLVGSLLLTTLKNTLKALKEVRYDGHVYQIKRVGFLDDESNNKHEEK